MVPSFCILIRSSFQPKELVYLCPHLKDSKGLPLIPLSMLISILFPAFLHPRETVSTSLSFTGQTASPLCLLPSPKLTLTCHLVCPNF